MTAFEDLPDDVQYEIEHDVFPPGDGTYDSPDTRAQHDEACGAGMLNWSDGSLGECEDCRHVLHLHDSPSAEEEYWKEFE